jgi:hypothetical protein
MDQELRDFLVQRYSAGEWLEAPASPGTVTHVSFTGSEVPGWALVSVRRNDDNDPPVSLSMWRHIGADDQVVSARLLECTDAGKAREQLLEELGNFQSPLVERRSGKEAEGDVAFGLGETMVTFARGNLVWVVRNAGPQPTHVGEVARSLDAATWHPSA